MSDEGDGGGAPSRRRRPAGRYWVAAAVVMVAAVLAGLWVHRIGQGLLSSARLTSQNQVQATPAAPGQLASADDVQRIGPAEAKALLDQSQAVLYDMRSKTSFDAGHAAGAISLPEDQIDAQLSTLPKGRALILYCT